MGHLPSMELAGLGAALRKSVVSECEGLGNTVDFTSTVHLGDTKCIKQHKIKSSQRENDAINRHSKHEMCSVAAGVIRHTVLQQTFLISRKCAP